MKPAIERAPRDPRRLRATDPRVAILFVVLLGWCLWPVLQVLAESVWDRATGAPTIAPWRRFVERGHGIYLARSVGISLATVALAGAFGTALALLYRRLDFPGRGAFAGLAMLPFTLPPLLGVFSIWTLGAEGGLLQKATAALFGGDGFWFEKGYAGVLVVHAYSMYVYFFVMVGGAVEDFDESQIEAARDLGASRAATWIRVVAPQLVPAWTGAALLAFMTSMASFTAPYFYIPARPTLTIGIQQSLEAGDEGLASADSVVLVVAAALFLMANARLERAFGAGTKGATRRPAPLRNPWARTALTIFAAALTLLLLAPHLAMARESLVKWGTGFVGRPVEYTFENYAALWRRPENRAPVRNSLLAAGWAAAAIALFATTSAWMETRREYPGKAIATRLVMLPWALPGTVIGVGLLYLTREANLLTFGAQLRGTVAILALAYFVRLMPLGHRTIKAAMLRAPEELEWAARDLGAGPWRAFSRITLPLVAAAILAATTLAFVTGLGEFVSSILLASHDNEPIAVRIDRIRRGPAGMQQAAAYGTCLTLAIGAAFLLAGRSTRRGM